MNYAPITKMASRLIKNFGQPLTCVHSTGMTYNTTTNESSETTIPHTVSGVIMTYSQKDVVSGKVQEGDVSIYLDSLEGYVPEIGDKISDASDSWEISNVITHKPATTVIFYECHAKK